MVDMMQALKPRDWGAGAVLNVHDRTRYGTGMIRNADDVTDDAQPVVTMRHAMPVEVPVDWLDYNGHMTESSISGCLCRIDGSAVIWMTSLWAAASLRRKPISSIWMRPVVERIEIRTRVLDGGGKKMHLLHEMFVRNRMPGYRGTYPDLYEPGEAPPPADMPDFTADTLAVVLRSRPLYRATKVMCVQSRRVAQALGAPWPKSLRCGGPDLSQQFWILRPWRPSWWNGSGDAWMSQIRTQ